MFARFPQGTTAHSIEQRDTEYRSILSVRLSRIDRHHEAEAMTVFGTVYSPPLTRE